MALPFLLIYTISIECLQGEIYKVSQTVRQRGTEKEEDIKRGRETEEWRKRQRNKDTQDSQTDNNNNTFALSQRSEDCK